MKARDTADIKWSDYFRYCTESPSGLVWRIDRYRGKPLYKFISDGDLAGSLNSSGRWVVSLHNKLYKCHRIVFEIVHGTIPQGMIVDHKDGIPGNNISDNLRVVFPAVNSRNQKRRRINTSGVTGVYKQENTTKGGVKHIYWTAIWSLPCGKQVTKSFVVRVHGEAEAFRLACEWRDKMIEELNASGAGYTDRHGKASPKEVEITSH